MKILYKDIIKLLRHSGVSREQLLYISVNRGKLDLDMFIPLFEYMTSASLYNDRISVYVIDWIKMLCIVQVYDEINFGGCLNEFRELRRLTGDMELDMDILRDFWVNHIHFPSGAVRQWIILIECRYRYLAKGFWNR